MESVRNQSRQKSSWNCQFFGHKTRDVSTDMLHLVLHCTVALCFLIGESLSAISCSWPLPKGRWARLQRKGNEWPVGCKDTPHGICLRPYNALYPSYLYAYFHLLEKLLGSPSYTHSHIPSPISA